MTYSVYKVFSDSKKIHVITTDTRDHAEIMKSVIESKGHSNFVVEIYTNLNEAENEMVRQYR